MTNIEDNFWWKKGIIYQIYPRSFKDSNNDGIGDLKGIISKLDYLEWLGIDAIWLSPIFSSPMIDFGYDVSDYTDIDPIFGNLEDFDELIRESHERDIKIVLDYVINHSSDQHSWFKESRSSKNNPKSDWYIWKDPNSDGGPPNNWIAVTGGSAWSYEKNRNQYFLHSFLPCQPDLNWRNSDLKNAMLDVLRFWMERGVDGFRIDMISWVIKDEKFRDDPKKEVTVKFDEDTDFPYEKLDHIYSANRLERFDILKEVKSTLDEFPNRVSIGEVNYFAPIDELIKYYGSKKNPIIDLPANFRFLYLPWTSKSIRDFVNSYDKLCNDGWPNYQLGNHDRPRVVTRIGEEKAKIAAMILLTLRGTPFIYNGEEIGMHDVKIPFEDIQDSWKDPKFSRDSLRTPMQWNSSKYAGFSSNKPWLPIADDYKMINVEKEKNDPKSFLMLYKKLIELRKDITALNMGKYEDLAPNNESCYIFRRYSESSNFVIALNFSDKLLSVNLNQINSKQVILSTYLDRDEIIDGENIRLRAFEGCIIKIS